MRASQQARWTKIKGTSAPAPVVKPAVTAKKKGGISPEGRARIVAAQKARWAAKKAGKWAYFFGTEFRLLVRARDSRIVLIPTATTI